MLAALVAVMIVVTVPALSGCSSDPEATAPRPRLRISGSGTCMPLLRILTSAYEADPPVTFVFLPGLHSGGGIKGVASGDLDIGSVSRLLNPEEEELELDYLRLADDGLVIAVHPTVTLDTLTSDQVRAVYAGEHESWAELGGPDLPIVILDRNEDESAKIILREYVLGDMPVTERAISLFYEPDMVDGLEKTPGAIGYFSLGFAISEEIPVRLVALDGVEASVSTIHDGSYTMVRPLGIVVQRPATPEIAAFVEWLGSDEARTLMEERGYAAADTPGE